MHLLISADKIATALCQPQNVAGEVLAYACGRGTMAGTLCGEQMMVAEA